MLFTRNYSLQEPNVTKKLLGAWDLATGIVGSNSAQGICLRLSMLRFPVSTLKSEIQINK